MFILKDKKCGWDDAKQLLSEGKKFIYDLKNYNKESIKSDKMKKIEK
jgi:hypothetical protein